MSKIELPALTSLRNLQKATILKTAGFHYREPTVDLSNYADTFTSLYSFTKQYSGSHELKNMVLARARRDAKTIHTQPIEFFLRVLMYQEEEQYSLAPTVRNYNECDFMIVLGCSAYWDEQIWLAGIGFSIFGSDYQEEVNDALVEKPYAILLPEIAKQGPIIHQLQTLTTRVRGSEIDLAMRETRKQIHWEFALLDILSEWISENYLPALFIEAGEANNWVKTGDITSEYAEQRYDQTARAYDFKELGNSLYGLYFPYE